MCLLTHQRLGQLNVRCKPLGTRWFLTRESGASNHRRLSAREKFRVPCKCQNVSLQIAGSTPSGKFLDDVGCPSQYSQTQPYE
ncbi:hypothetical protein BC830DRAFT_1124110 [Chytriomyces sp. MP71]|nr:hypothetical protein BC830DRAFT_1124110 [Chytriomyces sp. MP71]